ncbi:helix-turn-helix transcriptional regulator [Actinomadura meridiana]|uniref:Helix-turn-helix transcriptional regulator n=1 Tax=Actinomadura meridiana TaxID=559626 RepID=A0ABP8C9R7_9ACTN
MTDPEAARSQLGVRLRDLRLDAGLTGRQLATAAKFSPQKVSRIENGMQNIREPDIRTWATICGVADQVSELIAARREVARMYREHRREMKAGLVHIQAQGMELYEATSLLRVYEPTAVPGILFTEDFATASIAASARLHGRPIEEARPAARAKMARQRFLTEPTGRNIYHFVIEAGALSFGYGDSDVVREQLDFLTTVTRMPHVSFGIIPPTSNRIVLSQECFYIFDETVVCGDTWLTAIETRRKDQISFYLKAFDHLRRMAVYGDAARELIAAARCQFC